MRPLSSTSLGVALAACLVSCGSGGGSTTLCTDEYDPSGVYCDPATPRMSMRSAESVARESAPEGALLYTVVGGANGLVDPDGNAEDWHFRYYLPMSLEQESPFYSVTVFAPGSVRPSMQPFRAPICEPTVELAPYDSRAIVHDAIARFEEMAGVRVRLGEGGLLRVYQAHPCSETASGVSYGNDFAYYDETGRFLRLSR